MAYIIDADKLFAKIQNFQPYRQVWSHIWLQDLKRGQKTDRLTMLLQTCEMIKDVHGYEIDIPRSTPDDEFPITIIKGEIDGIPHWLPAPISYIPVPDPEVVPIAQLYLDGAKEEIDATEHIVKVNNQHVSDASTPDSTEVNTDPSDNFYESAPIGGISFELQEWRKAIEETNVPYSIPSKVEEAVREILVPSHTTEFNPYESEFATIASTVAATHYIFDPPASFIAAIPFYRSVRPNTPPIVIVDCEHFSNVPDDWKSAYRVSFASSKTLSVDIFDPLFIGLHLNYVNDKYRTPLPDRFPNRIMTRCARTNNITQYLGSHELHETNMDVVTDHKQVFFNGQCNLRFSVGLQYKDSDIRVHYPLDALPWNTQAPADEIFLDCPFHQATTAKFVPNYQKDLFPPMASIAKPEAMFRLPDDVVWSASVPGPHKLFICHFKHNVAYYQDPDTRLVWFHWHKTPFDNALALCTKTPSGIWLLTFGVRAREDHGMVMTYMKYYANMPPIHLMPFDRHCKDPTNLCIRDGRLYMSSFNSRPEYSLDRAPMRITKQWFWKVLRTIGRYKRIVDPIPILSQCQGPIVIDYRAPIPMLYVMIYRIRPKTMTTALVKAYRVLEEYILKSYTCITCNDFPDKGMIMLYNH